MAHMANPVLGHIRIYLVERPCRSESALGYAAERTTVARGWNQKVHFFRRVRSGIISESGFAIGGGGMALGKDNPRWAERQRSTVWGGRIAWPGVSRNNEDND